MILPAPILEKNPLFIFPKASIALILIVETTDISLTSTEKSPFAGVAPVTLVKMYPDVFGEGPVAPVGPVGPVLPVNPVGPVRPVGPVMPVNPVGPVRPVGPVAPVDPVGPVLPVGPVGPVVPVTPVVPDGPIPPIGAKWIFCTVAPGSRIATSRYTAFPCERKVL